MLLLKQVLFELCVLGFYPEVVVLLQQSLLIDFGLRQARRIILLFWKNVDLPSEGTWTKELAACVALERLTYNILLKLETRTFGKSHFAVLFFCLVVCFFVLGVGM